MKVTVTKVTPLYPNDSFVQWTVDDPTNRLSQFEVLRSGSPGGPFEAVSGTLSDDTFFYLDKGVNQHGLTTRVWYIVKAAPLHGAVDVVLSDPATAEYHDDVTRGRLSRKARYDLDISLRRLNGVRVLLLKRKRFGLRCTTCYDPVSKESVLSHCSECYGTTYTGGYHTPVEAYGKFDPSLITRVVDLSGESETSLHGITILDYPAMEIDDIIVEMRTNRRYLVKRRISTEARRVLVHQDLQVSELSRSAVEYNIPLSLS